MQIIKTCVSLWDNFFSTLFVRINEFLNTTLLELIPDAIDLFTIGFMPKWLKEVLDYIIDITSESGVIPENSIFLTTMFEIMFGVGVPFLVVYTFIKWLNPFST